MESFRKTKKQVFSGVENAEDIKKLGNNTYSYRIGNKRIIRFHLTDIIIQENNTVIFNTSNWKTITTKQRLNDFCPIGFRFTQEKNTWYVFYNGEKYDFFDGMKFDLYNKKPIGFSPFIGVSPLFKHKNKQLKAINKFVNSYLDLLYSGKMELPSGGDCLICNIERSNDCPIHASHLKSHIEEDYFVPSLIWATLRFNGAGDLFKQVIYELQTGKIHNFSVSLRDNFKRFMVKYFKKALI